MKQTLIAAILCGCAFAATAAEAESKLLATRGALEEWVKTRQLISKTRSDWQADKEMMQQTMVLLERELKGVEEQFSKLSTNNVQAEKERVEAETLLKASNEGIAPAQEFAVQFESSIRALLPRFPEPLKDILKPLLTRLPGSTNTQMRITDRTQVLLGIMNELDKFNNAVNVFSDKRQNDKGGEVSVETVYVGLGSAYFVNDAGDFAGTKRSPI